MQFGHDGYSMHGQLGIGPSYPLGPQVGHLKLAAQSQFLKPEP